MQLCPESNMLLMIDTISGRWELRENEAGELSLRLLDLAADYPALLEDQDDGEEEE